jgi:hypothetical protein
MEGAATRRVERWNITIDGSTVGFATLTESCVGSESGLF